MLANISYTTQKPLKTIFIEEINSETLPATDKCSPATVIKDDQSSIPEDLAVMVEMPVATTTSRSTAVKESPVTTEDTLTVVKSVSSTVKDVPGKTKENSTTVKGESNAVKNSPVLKEDTSTVSKSPSVTTSKQQQLPTVPTSSVIFMHDWKRLQTHPDLKSNYFQVLISSTFKLTS